MYTDTTDCSFCRRQWLAAYYDGGPFAKIIIEKYWIAPQTTTNQAADGWLRLAIAWSCYWTRRAPRRQSASENIPNLWSRGRRRWKTIGRVSAQLQHNSNTAAPRVASGDRHPPHANYNAVKYSYHAANSSCGRTAVRLFRLRRSTGTGYFPRTFFPSHISHGYHTLQLGLGWDQGYG